MFKNIRFKRISIKRSSLKTFGFFLLFASLIWFFVQISKEYTQVIDIPVSYVNVPMDKSIAKERPQNLKLRIQDKGFAIWYYKIFRPEVKLDLGKALEENGELVYNFEANREFLEDQVNINFEKARFIQESLSIKYQPKKKKRVKVNPEIDLSYAVGYSAREPVKLRPDSIQVSGPENIIDTLQSLNTVYLRINNINTNVSGKVKIDTSSLGMLSFYTNEVSYSQEVEKFTEGSVKVPIEVLNLPENTNISIFPKEVLVYYQVNLKQYEMVKAENFRVVCDYNDIDDGDDFIIARISESPSFVSNLRLNERKIQFVIKR
ncbi:YbbR-like domain-containing protein [Salegentibacter sp. JZCK2]|uniref:YbbR-like domain-containing protein n=1 Tax=Salegentibacter tibetensis TaxID=2873600 RepID=UPI001CC9EE02|nr:YbbR-like domain-containing protein [Salegentibacter tibetensis]MBZ9730500.1 YbbR-like domain-containing protein [Salegentibacter tibetensis]